MRDIAIPNGLAEIGYGAADVDDLVEGALKQQRLLATAPLEITAEDLVGRLRARPSSTGERVGGSAAGSPTASGDRLTDRIRASGRLGSTHEPSPPPSRHPGRAGGTPPDRRPDRTAVIDDLDPLRSAILDPDHLVRVLASGRRKGQPVPLVEGREVRRVEIRYVDLKAGRHLQVTSFDETQAHTTNLAVGAGRGRRGRRAAGPALRQLARRHDDRDPSGPRHQEARGCSLHTRTRAEPVEVDRGHDRDQAAAAGRGRPGAGRARDHRRAGSDQADPAGEVPPGRGVPAAARRVPSATPSARGTLRHADRGRPAADRRPRLRQRLPHLRRAPLPGRTSAALPVRVTGVDVKQQSADHNTAVAAGLGIDADFVVGTIADATPARAARRGAGPARLRHGDRRRAGPRARVGGGAGARRAVLPPRHRIAAAHGAHAGAVRDAHPARHPARAVRRHPHRRAARHDPAARGLPRRRGRVRRERPHPPQHADPRRPHRPTCRDLATQPRSTTTCWRRGA